MKKIHTLLLLISGLLSSGLVTAQYDNMFGVTLERYTTARPVPRTDIIDGMVVAYGDLSRISSGYHVYTDSVNPWDTDAPGYGHEGVYIERGGSKLRVEYRTPPSFEEPDENDTFPLYTYNLGQTGTHYQFEILANVDPGYVQIAKIIDLHPYPSMVPTETTIPLTGLVDLGTGPKYGSLFYSFDVNSADTAGTLSKDPHRFLVVVSKNATYSRFAFNHLSGTRDPRGIHLNWDAIGEAMVTSYEIQSFERNEFTTVGIVNKGTQTYAYPEYTIGSKTIRIKANLPFGKFEYSDTVELEAVLSVRPFTVLPNPAQSGTEITLQFNKQSLGKTEIAVFSLSGQPMFRKNITATTGTKVILPHLSPGIYVVKVGQQVQKLVIQ